MRTDGAGRITMLAANTARMNELAVSVALRAQSALETRDSASIAVPLGAALKAPDFGAIIAAAGMAAHLAGALAAATTLPVIGIPVASALGGMDALLATVQMPSGIPVATVAIDGAKNAAYLAVQILAVTEPALADALAADRAATAETILAADAALEVGK